MSTPAPGIQQTRCASARPDDGANEFLLQRAIRDFLKVRNSYDVLPLSFRLIVFDTSLSVKESLNILIQNGMFSSEISSPSGDIIYWTRYTDRKVSAL